jgi:hypothetical protein
MIGLSGGNPRLPLKPLTQAQKDELRRDLVWAGVLQKAAIAAE